MQKHVHITIRGIVQGVGFRPFLQRLAKKYNITGWIQNTGGGLSGELEGEKAGISAFFHALRTAPPPLADIEHIEVASPEDEGGFLVSADQKHFDDFRILPSKITPFETLIPPDAALCDDCRKELYDTSDRRFRYPFINCTNCGPRYTILESLPYDRSRTVMKKFPMCGDCEKEYSTIDDRRYHAQPDCCPSCGPEAFFLDSAGTHLFGDPFSLAQQALKKGNIIAVKGTGGIHLACDARNEHAIRRLREIKRRAHKPFALMCRSSDTARELCAISEEEEKLLAGARRPVILLSKKEPFPCSFASGNSPRAGLMLPYTPFHELLMDGIYGGPDVVVMTSANLPGCPVLTENNAAVSALSGIADGFLLHNRPIANRCDDSLVTLWDGRPYFFRRSRGYAPAPLTSEQDVTGIIAMGAEQKASFALGRGHHIFLSPHIGDLKNTETLEHFRTSLQVYRHLFEITPSVYVCDAHPDYLSSAEAHIAASRDHVPVLAVSHHWAHMVSCMADNRINKPVFGIIWDGTGLAPDHSVWGGEFLTGDAVSYERLGSIRPVCLIGGDKAAEEIGRIGVALLSDAKTPDNRLSPYTQEQISQFTKLLDTPFTIAASSIGRLFDGICSLICKKTMVDYEGEGAVLLESLSPCEEPDFSPGGSLETLSYPLDYYEENNVRIWDTRPVVRGICEDIISGQDSGQTAFRFLITLCCMARDQTAVLNPEKLPVVLSGGVFQNRFLLSGITQLLKQAGFTVYSHRRAATNDEGLCLGQLAIARAAFPQLFVD